MFAFFHVVLNLALCRKHFNIHSVQYSFLVCIKEKIFRLFMFFTEYDLHKSWSILLKSSFHLFFEKHFYILIRCFILVRHAYIIWVLSWSQIFNKLWVVIRCNISNMKFFLKIHWMSFRSKSAWFTLSLIHSLF